MTLKMFDSHIASLKYPQDAKEIGRLGIQGFQSWYLAQNPKEMIFLGQFKEFKRFIFWHYTLPVKCLRLYYKIKRILTANA